MKVQGLTVQTATEKTCYYNKITFSYEKLFLQHVSQTHKNIYKISPLRKEFMV